MSKTVNGGCGRGGLIIAILQIEPSTLFSANDHTFRSASFYPIFRRLFSVRCFYSDHTATVFFGVFCRYVFSVFLNASFQKTDGDPEKTRQKRATEFGRKKAPASHLEKSARQVCAHCNKERRERFLHFDLREKLLRTRRGPSLKPTVVDTLGRLFTFFYPFFRRFSTAFP